MAVEVGLVVSVRVHVEAGDGLPGLGEVDEAAAASRGAVREPRDCAEAAGRHGPDQSEVATAVT